MSDRFTQIIPRVLAHEGGYVDHPSDPGGATNRGITIGTLSAVRGRPVTKADVKRLTLTETETIYRLRYWDTVSGDKLPIGSDYAVFDGGVMSGPSRSVRWLQKALGATPDGIVGPVTLRLAGAASPAALLAAVTDRRMAFLKRLSTWKTFGDGWEDRVEGVGNAARADIAALTGAMAAETIEILNPKSAILPAARPKQAAGVTRAIIEAHRDLLPDAFRHAGVICLFVRGYYSQSFGKAGNDRAVYDDAAFLMTPDQVTAWNANADPSAFRRRVATLKGGQAILYSRGLHGLSRPGGGYPAFRQASDVTVIRDQIGEDRDSAKARFWTNLHKGGSNGTSSLGCLTIPPNQWDPFYAAACNALEAAGQSRLPVILLEYAGDHPPVPKEPNPAPVETLDDVSEAGSSPPQPTANPEPSMDNPTTEPGQRPPADEKAWWKSKGVIGSLGAILVPIAGMAGMQISSGDVSQAIELGTAIFTAASGLLALIGRVTANTKVR